MNDAVQQMKLQLEKATAKIKGVKLRAARGAVKIVKENTKAMKSMKEQLKGYQHIVRVATARFAEKKVHQALVFEGIAKERYYKTRDNARDEAKLVEKERAKEKLLSDKYVDAEKRVQDLKINIEAMQITESGAQGEEIFASDKDKEFAKFKAETTQQNFDAFKRQLKLAEETEQSYKDDLEDQQRVVKDQLQSQLKAKQDMKQTQDFKNQALKHTKEERERSEELINRPLPVHLQTTEEEKDEAVEKVEESTEEKMRAHLVVLTAEKDLQKAVVSGKASDMSRAEDELEKLKHPHSGRSSSSEPTGTCKFHPRTCKPNGAKCKGEVHAIDGEPGALECALPDDMRCYDKLTSYGVFVPIATPGIGFCAPWLPGGKENATYPDESAASESSVLEAAALGGRTYVKAGQNPSKNDEFALGTTYVVKLGAFHPDGAKKNVGMLAFKRIVCHDVRCEEFKTSKCFMCDRDIFLSEATALTTVDENLNFLKDCALSILDKHDQNVPEAYRCSDGDLLSANRALIAW